MNAEPDAFRNDLALVDGLLEQLPLDANEPALFIADRQFCDLRLMGLIVELRGEHFLIRHNKTVDFLPDASHPAGKGTDAKGRSFVDQRGWLGAVGNKKRRYVRRITLQRPGAEEVSILTDLLDERTYPAKQLLELYLQRWGIEKVFQQVTEVFSLKHLIGTAPKAAIFQSAFCFVIYNVIQLIKSHIADVAQKELQQISTRKVFDDIREQLRGYATLAGNGDEMIAALKHPSGRRASASMLRKSLRQLLANLWTDWWIKAPTRARDPTPTPKRYAPSGRASVQRVLEEHQLKHKLHSGDT
jgi:Transposase DDE domain